MSDMKDISSDDLFILILFGMVSIVVIIIVGMLIFMGNGANSDIHSISTEVVTLHNDVHDLQTKVADQRPR